MISLLYIFIFSIFLFFLGLSTLILHKNLLFIFVGIEIMMNAILLIVVSISNFWENIDGQILYILFISFSAIEISVGLTLLVQCFQKKYTLNINKLTENLE